MAYDESLAQRIRHLFIEKNVLFDERKMMGGLCFMVNEKMCCGIHIDKQTGQNFLMARVGDETAKKVLKPGICIPMEFTGRVMKGFVFILLKGFESESELSYWLKLCLDFNPLAQSSKQKHNLNNRNKIVP